MFQQMRFGEDDFALMDLSKSRPVTMKVLIVSATFPPLRSGGAYHAFRLSQLLAERQFGVSVVTSRIENIVTDKSMSVYPVMQNWSWGEMPRLLRIARRCCPDVVNLHFTGAIYDDQPMITFVPTLMKKLLPGVRVVTQIEYPEPASVHRLSRAVRIGRKLAAYWAGPREIDYGYGTILRDSDQIVVLSDRHSVMLANHSARVREKCVLIPPPPLMLMSTESNGASRRRGREMVGVSADDFLCGYFGYLYPGKGIETLLEGFQVVAKNNRNLRLVMVGDGNEVVLKRLNRPDYVQELLCIARALGIDSQVIWTAYTPPETDLASTYLRACDACILPFDAGVMLNRSSFASAVAHGLPTITTKGDTLEPPFVDGDNVLLCKPRDSASLAEALERLVNNPSLRQRLSAGALALADEWFSWDKCLERTIETFRATD
jgi:glycosyltransferase involved in cell wall biosynthesis